MTEISDPAAEQAIVLKEDGPGCYLIQIGTASAGSSFSPEAIDSVKLTSKQETAIPAVAIPLRSGPDGNGRWQSEFLVRPRAADDPENIGI